jgi:hypothetical protein
MGLRLFVFTLLQVLASGAHACRFAQDAQPGEWYAWSTALFAADVESVEPDADKALDLITVRVVETYKGPEGAAATLKVPKRMWSSCRLQRPPVGARVLVALNPNSDTLLVPLNAEYAQLLRQRRGTTAPPPSGEATFHY